MSRAPVSCLFGLMTLSLVLAGACGTELEAPPQDDALPPGAIRGTLVTYVFDFADRSQTQREHALRLPSGEERALRFAEEPSLASGTRIDVWGSDDGQTIHVVRMAALQPVVDTAQSALVNGTKKTSKRWAFVLVDTGGSANLTKATAQTKLFGDGPSSIKTYYREVSYGLQDLTGDVFGPLTFDPAGAAGGLCQGFQAASRALRPMIEGTYDQYLYYFLSPIGGCPWGGVAILGTAAQQARDSYYNASSDCVVLVQEPGHNFGMVHSSSMRCTKDGTPVSMIDPSDPGGTCQHDEYGNPFDPMGGGAGGNQMLGTCYHMNGVQKAYQDWLEGCNIVKATTSGTFTIYPLEKACNGTQLLQIPLPGTRSITFPASPAATLTRGQFNSYYLELRAPIGLDRGLRTPRVFVMAAGNLRDARTRGNNNWLIDTTPETRTVNDAALSVGKTFVDPAPMGPKFTVISADETKAVISVQLNGEEANDAPGNGTCSNDMPFTGPGVSSCEAIASPGTGGAAGAGGAGMGGAGGKAGAGGGGGTGGGGGGAGTGGLVFRDAGAIDALRLSPSPPADPMLEEGADAGETPAVPARAGCSCRLAATDSAPGLLPALGALFFVLRRRSRRAGR